MQQGGVSCTNQRGHIGLGAAPFACTTASQLEALRHAVHLTAAVAASGVRCHERYAPIDDDPGAPRAECGGLRAAFLKHCNAIDTGSVCFGGTSCPDALEPMRW